MAGGLVVLVAGGDPWTVAIPAALLAATLLAWLRSSGGQDPGPRPLPPVGLVEVLLATAAIAAGVCLAVYHLDVRLRHDETRAIALYATQPLAVAASTYDSTNNHVLHTLLVWVAHQFGGWNRIALRMPAFLSFCLLLPALWWFVRREYGPTAALFAITYLSTSPFLINYATNARGYTLMLLLFVVALLCGQALVRSPSKRGLWAAWAGAVGLGFYTVPLMAFSAATAVAWMLLARWRRCGSAGFRLFAAKTAAWSVAALAIAAALYLPVVVAEGLDGPRTLWTVASLFLGQAVELVAHPATLWDDWHQAIHPWAQGALLVLVVVGTTARGRSCGGKGTLLWATGLAWGLLLARPLLPQARMAVWTLLTLMVMAGAGAALVLGRARTPVRGAALALALATGAYSWWTKWPEVTTDNPESTPTLALPARLLSVAEWAMRPGDYFATCSTLRFQRTVVDIQAVHPVERDVARFHSEAAADSSDGWRVHRVGPLMTGATPQARGDDRGRLFLFEVLPSSYARCAGNSGERGGDVREALEARWPGHELAAQFATEESGGTGKVYVLDDWSPSRDGAASRLDHPSSGT